jgi:O-antigen/teichoic acid export membrane protein
MGFMHSMPLPDRLRGLARPLLLMAFRIGNMAAKFLLALYTARYLGLSDLGIYGLIVGGTILTPAILGLGTSDWVVRQIVTMSRADALAAMTTRLAFPVVMHAVAQPLLWLVNLALGSPVPWPLVWASGLILFLEHIANDASDMLIARGRALLASFLLFVRAGLWPFPVIAWGLVDPSARTLNALLIGWIGGLVLLWIVLAGNVIAQQRWRYMRLRWRWLFSGVPASVPFYIKDIAAAASLHLDRFVISFFLGLELTGVYTLFWSIANVVHNLAVYAVVQPQTPALIAAHSRADSAEFHAAQRRILFEASIWAGILALGAIIFVPMALPYLDRPALQANLPIFWLILAATLTRVGADSYAFILLALHRDRAIAVISVAGALASATLNMMLIPILGLAGAGTAYLLTGSGLWAARFWSANSSKPSIGAAAPQPKLF